MKHLGYLGSDVFFGGLSQRAEEDKESFCKTLRRSQNVSVNGILKNRYITKYLEHGSKAIHLLSNTQNIRALKK